MKASVPLILLLDYDGSLVPFNSIPALAKPGPALLALVRALADRPGTEVHLVSGRKREELEAWFGQLSIHLHAEHGLWSRAPGEPGRAQDFDVSWKERVLPIFVEYADRTPGALVEEKASGLAWHYRAADPQYGLLQANELRQHLTQLLSNAPVELVNGHFVIEVRPHGANKGVAVRSVLGRAEHGLIVAIGDDETDEDMFAALPPNAVSVRVGTGDSRAGYRVSGVAEVLHLLRALVEGGPPPGGAPSA